MRIDNTKLRFDNLDRDDLGSMKGTALLWGPMLARFGKVVFTELPGGCTLGARPLGPQYDSFMALGVTIKNGDHSVSMDASKAKAQEIWLSEMSPTITENVIMLATSLSGVTKIVGAASEPNVQELCNFLIDCGVEIEGVGSSILSVYGVKKLKAPKPHRIYEDHHEVTTFLAMTAATGGNISIQNEHPEFYRHIDYIFSKFGVEVIHKNGVTSVNQKKDLHIDTHDRGYLVVRAQPWPGLLVDLLPMFIPLALSAKEGQVMFHNWMYESGLFWTSELTKLGANIIMADPHRVIVSGGRPLKGDTIECPYIIRAAVALTMSAMLANGETKILNADALYRGHPNFSENLKKLGAMIEINQK
jgi:UDP-N-acetylglucosamine 1-carboxyvinyltransferase